MPLLGTGLGGVVSPPPAWSVKVNKERSCPGLSLSVTHRLTPPIKGTRTPPTTDPALHFPGNSTPKTRSSPGGRGPFSRAGHIHKTHGHRQGGAWWQQMWLQEGAAVRALPCFSCAHLNDTPYISCHLGAGHAPRKPAASGGMTVPICMPSAVGPHLSRERQSCHPVLLAVTMRLASADVGRGNKPGPPW